MNGAKFFYNNENAARRGAMKLGVAPQNKATADQRSILQVWAVRPPSSNGGTPVYQHEELGRFAPERPDTSVRNSSKRNNNNNENRGNNNNNNKSKNNNKSNKNNENRDNNNNKSTGIFV